MATESGMDQSVLDDNIRRTVERAALRNVRKLADELETEQLAKRRLEKRALIIAAVIGAVSAVWLVLALIASDEKFDRGQKIQLPDKVVMPKKD